VPSHSRAPQPEKDSFAVKRTSRGWCTYSCGKTDMSEFATGGISRVPWRQVRNPSTSPEHQSAPSERALRVAANFANSGTGSDTGGSSFPCSAPVWWTPANPGLNHRDGILPVSFTQDNHWPILANKSLTTTWLNAMVDTTSIDPVTALSAGKFQTYARSWPNGLKGARLGG